MTGHGAALALLLSAAALPGCAIGYEIGVRVGGEFGEALFREAFEPTLDVALPAPPDAAFEAVSRELHRNGSVGISDPFAGFLRARVGESDVRVVLTEGRRKGWSVATIASRTIVGDERDRATAHRLSVGFEREAKEARFAETVESPSVTYPDDGTAEILVAAGSGEVFETARTEIVRRSRRSASDAGTRTIEAEVGGSDVMITLADGGWEGPTTITVKARDHDGRYQDRWTAGSLAVGIRNRLRQERLAKYARPDAPPQ